MLDAIRRHVIDRRYELSRHALDRSILRNIRIAELEEVLTGPCRIIEDYPDDKYWPSCLVLGLYEPAESEWIDGSIRRYQEVTT